MRQASVLAGTTLLVLSTTVPMPSYAANPQFQSFFFDVCLAPTGLLATRCGETIGGTGDLSGDSESSLNPSQNLSHTLSSTALVAQVRTAEARERAENIREGEEPAEDEAGSAAFGPFSLLVHVRGTQFERDRDPILDRERGLEGDGWGIEIGFDRRMSEKVFLGALVAFESTNYDFDAELPGVNFVPGPAAGHAEIDAQSVTLFGVFNASEHFFVDGSIGYGRQEHTFRRNSIFQDSLRASEVDLRTVGDTDSRELWAGVNAGFDLGQGASTFGPYAGLTFTHATIDGYTERDLSASGLNMTFGKVTTESLLGHVGLRADHAFSTSRGVIVPQVKVEYLHEFKDDPAQIVSNYVLNAGSSAFALTGDKPDPDKINVGAGLTAYWPNGWIVFLNFDTLIDGDLDRDRVTLGFRFEF